MEGFPEVILSALRRGWWLSLIVLVLSAAGWILIRPRPAAGAWSSECRIEVGELPVELRSAFPPGAVPDAATLVESAAVRRMAAALAVARKEAPADGWRTTDDAEIRAAVAAAKGDEVRAMEPRLAASVTVERKDAAVLVRARSSSPAEAVLFAAAVARCAQAVGRETAVEALAAARKRLDERTRQVETKILELGNTDLEAQDADRRLASATAAAAQLDAERDRVLVRQAQVRLRIRSLEAAEHRLRESLPSGPEEESLNSPVLRRLRQDMDAIQITVAQDRLSKTPEAPRYKDLMLRLRDLEEEYRAELYRARGRAIVDLKESLNGVELEIQALEERRLGLMLDDLATEVNVRSSLRSELVEARKERAATADLHRRLAGTRTAVEIHAGPPTAPVMDSATAPPPLWTGLFGAVVLAILAAFFVPDRGPSHVRTDADLKDCLNLRSLGVIPDTTQEPSILRRSTSDPQSELYSAAATVLRSYMADHEFKTCVVTSAAAGEGKTTAAANLAIALARKGVSVALLDGDLRRPRLHEVFSLDPSRGLTTLLRGEETESETVLATLEIPTLRVMPSGPTGEGAADLLESRGMADLLKVMRDRYDVVLIDAPPVSDVVDALTLARLADTCVWVIRAGFCDRRALGWAKHRLTSIGADVAGALLTGTDRRGGERLYDYRPVSARTA